VVITSRNFKQQKILRILQLHRVVDSDGERNKAIFVKAGEEFEVFIPVGDLKLNDSSLLKGWISVIILSAFGRQDFLLYYRIFERELEIKNINPIFQFCIELPIFFKLRNQKRGDEILEI
jgi:hypothetical protein